MADDVRDIAIATVSDCRFLPAACCQLVSTARHLATDSRAQLFLVLCDVSDEDVADAHDFFAARDLPVRIVLPDFVERMMPPLEGRWPRAAYLRLYFDWLFDQRWRRVIYLDADTRVNAPLEPLLQVDLRGQPIGAVHDFIYYVNCYIVRRRRDLFLADDAPYFQSGVMVFDWAEMLACDGLARARQFLTEHPESCYEAPDQDALNATFEDCWTPLDPSWNLHEIYLMFARSLQPKIMHYTSTKPWSRRRPRAWRGAAAWYRAELACSPWQDFVETQSMGDVARADVQFLLRRYSPHIRQLLSKVAPGLLRRLSLERRSADLPWVPKSSGAVEEMARALTEEAASGRRLRPPEAVLSRGHW